MFSQSVVTCLPSCSPGAPYPASGRQQACTYAAVRVVRMRAQAEAAGSAQSVSAGAKAKATSNIQHSRWQGRGPDLTGAHCSCSG